MEIKPHVGTDHVRMGIKQADAVAILGEASSKEIEPFTDGNKVTSLRYDQHGLELSFYTEDDNRLATLTFFAASHSLFGLHFIGKPEAFLQQEAVLKVLPDLTLDDDYPELSSKDYASDQWNLSFWIDDGIITSISIFPQYEADDETVIWPEKQ